MHPDDLAASFAQFSDYLIKEERAQALCIRHDNEVVLTSFKTDMTDSKLARRVFPGILVLLLKKERTKYNFWTMSILQMVILGTRWICLMEKIYLREQIKGSKIKDKPHRK